jgi:TPR repeat protein
MLLFPRWYNRDRERAEALEQELTALQSALNKCRDVAGRCSDLPRGTMPALLAGVLALGFVLGVYREQIAQSVTSFAMAVGISSPRDADAALAAFEKRNYDGAMKLAMPLAEQGDLRAQTLVGQLYYRGRGVKQDDYQAARWFKLAADAGDAAAQLHLGNMYAEGQGVPQDSNEAARWYRRAADQGYAQAQYNLGLWYATAEGGVQDNVAAHMWFNLAAARFPTSDTRNRELAVRNRDVVAARMTPDQVIEAQKLAREWKAK